LLSIIEKESSNSLHLDTGGKIVIVKKYGMEKEGKFINFTEVSGNKRGLK